MLNDLAKLLKRNQDQYFLIAVAVTQSRAAAEDAVADALLSVSRSSTAIENLDAYLRTAIRHQAIRNLDDPRHVAFDPDWLEAIDRQDALLVRSVATCLSTLSADQRETIVLHIYAGMSFREIAEQQEASINTVASWYRRGIEAMRRHFDE